MSGDQPMIMRASANNALAIAREAEPSSSDSTTGYLSLELIADYIDDRLNEVIAPHLPHPMDVYNSLNELNVLDSRTIRIHLPSTRGGSVPHSYVNIHISTATEVDQFP
jgi:hypothetical protein